MGLTPFCVTIDEQAEDYLPHLFGSKGFVVVKDAAALPQVLPRLYAQLTTEVATRFEAGWHGRVVFFRGLIRAKYRVKIAGNKQVIAPFKYLICAGGINFGVDVLRYTAKASGDHGFKQLGSGLFAALLFAFRYHNINIFA